MFGPGWDEPPDWDTQPAWATERDALKSKKLYAKATGHKWAHPWR